MLQARSLSLSSSSSSSLVLCPRAGPWLPNSPILSVFSLPLHITICLIQYIIDHAHSWPSLGLFPSILPSSTNFSRPSPLTTCPIQFFSLSYIVFIKLSLFVHGAKYLFICPFIHPANLSHSSPHHISKAFKRFISPFLMVHVLHPYRTTGHTSVLTNLFLRSTLILLVSSSFLLLNASFVFEKGHHAFTFGNGD